MLSHTAGEPSRVSPAYSIPLLMPFPSLELLSLPLRTHYLNFPPPRTVGAVVLINEQGSMIPRVCV